ncbi:transglycosylase domain-containing protein [Aureibacillus halotolerans]|nr:PBP1A family penicillin-binding protein [Aureibacillus halotolerans]
MIFFIFLAVSGYLSIIYAGDYVLDEELLVFDAASTLVDERGNELTSLYVENRDPVTEDQIPDHVKQAFIAVEDSRFLTHHGLDIRAIGRALYRDLMAGAMVEGGSTITQQLAKNVFLTNDKTWLRKSKEAVIAINLENHYTKDQILEMYLNRIYFGHGAYGIGAAAKTYYNKPVSQLTLEEGAMLAAIPKAPSHYSPIDDKEAALNRRNLILSLMADQGFISHEEAVRKKGTTLHASLHEIGEQPALYTYIDLVMKDAEKRYQLSREEILTGGYTIKVPIQIDLQKKVYQAFEEGAFFPDLQGEKSQGAFILLDNQTGKVIAAQGGRGYEPGSFNRLYAKRQPGSVIKPLAVYGPALDAGYTPYSVLQDQKQSYGAYSPSNYNGTYQGKVSMYDALQESLNAPAVWLLDQIGLNTGKQPLLEAGAQVKNDGLALGLGGTVEGMSPMLVATMFRSFANEGVTATPVAITSIHTRDGELLEPRKQNEQKRLFTPQTAWYMTRMLEGVVNEGTGSAGEYSGALAGKTGTTQYEAIEGGNRDIWFAGYTPEMTGVVWMGYDRTTEKSYIQGGSDLATKLMKSILPEEEALAAFTKPQQVKELAKPVDLQPINDLTMHNDFHIFDWNRKRLSWTPQSDKRVVYRIYEKTNDYLQLIGQVTGQGSYSISSVSAFFEGSFYVVPYNPLTELEGTPSNIVHMS